MPKASSEYELPLPRRRAPAREKRARSQSYEQKRGALAYPLVHLGSPETYSWVLHAVVYYACGTVTDCSRLVGHATDYGGTKIDWSVQHHGVSEGMLAGRLPCHCLTQLDYIVLD